MKRTAVSSLLLKLLFMGMLTLAFSVQPVKAAETLYIRADGSIDPPTANITTADNVTYSFTDNNYDSIVVERDNIVVDGAGYVLQGAGSGTGMNLTQRSNVTIKNMSIEAFTYAIYLEASSNNKMFANKIAGSVRLTGASNNIISNNIVAGINIYEYSNNNLVFENNCSNIWINKFSSSNYVYGNNVTNRGSAGIEIWDNSFNNTISGNIVANCNWGVFLMGAYNNTVLENIVTDSVGHGIFLRSSFYNNIIRNKAANNALCGIGQYNGGWNNYFENTLTNNTIGIDLSGWNHNVSRNNIAGNDYGIRLIGAFPELSCINNTVSGNTITNNTYAIGLLTRGNPPYIDHPRNNKIYGNTITNNDYGIYLERMSLSDNNIIFHNNLLDNNYQVYDLSWGDSSFPFSMTTWDNGYSSGGNYWSDYAGVDFYHGAYQNETGSDGIGDFPYVIDQNNTDTYPLMKPYGGPHDIGITNATSSKTVVGRGYPLHITLKTVNYGIYEENDVNVNICANATPTLHFEFSLIARRSMTITVDWYSTGFLYGNYAINAEATPVQEETDTNDNSYKVGWVLVTIPGDVNGDGDVDVGDQRKMQNAMFTTPSSSDWNPNIDIDGDGDVDVGDQRIQQLHMFESS